MPCPDPTGTTTSPSAARKPIGTEAARRLLEVLTAQQASLVRALALGDSGYLNRSFFVDPGTGRRVAHEVEEKELSRFTASWGLAPVECIRAMNQAIRGIPESQRRERYIKAALDLEILMDQEVWAAGDGQVYRGIPASLMHGYTDMGSLPSPTERNGREKIKVDKERMRSRLLECRREGVTSEEPDKDTIIRFYNQARQDIEFDEQGVDKLSREFGNESIVLSEYLDKGMGVCRHLAIFLQLCLQEAGIHSRLVKGNLQFFVFSGRHAWNMVRLGGEAALVDVTHPNVNRPFIIVGSDEEEVYRRVQEYARSYVPTPDENNHYKIGA